MMLKAAEEYPMNLGFLGKGNCSDEAPLIEQVKAGAMGLKIHEDWGATPAVINHCLNVADEYDVQVAIHTDTLNEGGCVEDTLAAIGGRTIHTSPHRGVQAEDMHRTSFVQRQQEMYFRHPQIRPCHTRSIHWMSIWTC